MAGLKIKLTQGRSTGEKETNLIPAHRGLLETGTKKELNQVGEKNPEDEIMSKETEGTGKWYQQPKQNKLSNQMLYPDNNQRLKVTIQGTTLVKMHDCIPSYDSRKMAN